LPRRTLDFSQESRRPGEHSIKKNAS
jgi:hypothetical protein